MSVENFVVKPALETVQAGRGLAALLVVLFHLSSTIFGKEKYFPEIFMPAWAIFSGFLLVAVVASLGFHVLVERNLRRWLARKTARALA